MTARGRWVVVLATLGVAIVAAGGVLAVRGGGEGSVPTPRATGTVVVSAPLDAATEAQVATSRAVQDELARALAEHLVPPAELATLTGTAVARALPDTRIVEFSVPVIASATDRGPAARSPADRSPADRDLANAVTRCNLWLQVYVDHHRQLQLLAQRQAESTVADLLDRVPPDAPPDRRATYLRRLDELRVAAANVAVPVRVLDHCAVGPPRRAAR